MILNKCIIYTYVDYKIILSNLGHSDIRLQCSVHDWNNWAPRIRLQVCHIRNPSSHPHNGTRHHRNGHGQSIKLDKHLNDRIKIFIENQIKLFFRRTFTTNLLQPEVGLVSVYYCQDVDDDNVKHFLFRLPTLVNFNFLPYFLFLKSKIYDYFYSSLCVLFCVYKH